MKIFNKVGAKRPPSNKFDLSHERKMSMKMGHLVPSFVQEVLPGDKFRVSTEVMLRFAPLLAPIMHRVNVTTHYFYVPYRLVWDEWKDFITGGREGTSAPSMPVIRIDDADTASRFHKGSVADYLGMPTLENATPTDAIDVSALPFRAYALIYDEYYRDQNLEASLDISKASGVVSDSEMIKLTGDRYRAWEKDYFTSALPWAQRGGDVTIPFDGEADVVYKAASDVIRTATDNPPLDGTLTSSTGKVTISGQGNQRIENIEGIDLQNVSVTVNELRRSVRLQEWLEKNARGGARYVEQLLSHFGVRSSDQRLQRPEYLGGGRQPVVVSEVLSTFQESGGEGNPQGNMAGHAVSVGRSNRFSKFFEEHGIVIGIMSVLPKTAYQQGIPKMFRRLDKFDFAWPEFAQIGEQEIQLSELYYDQAATSGQKDETFGYQSRYAEYKYAASTVHGEFRDSLSFWHMGRIFASKPALNNTFVKSDPTTRIFAVEEGEQLYVQLYNKVDAIRPLPYFGTPTI